MWSSRVWRTVGGRLSVTSVAVALLAATALLGSTADAAPFAIEKFEAKAQGPSGEPASQAGSHPFALTTNLTFSHHEFTNEFGETYLLPEQDPKDVEVNLPAGMVVNPNATTVRCAAAEIVREGGCPNAAAVGEVVAHLSFFPEAPSPVYNMVPPPGVPAELAFNLAGTGAVVSLLGGVRTASDYGLSATVTGISQKLAVEGATVTLWGDPSAEAHDRERGLCGYSGGHAKVVEEEEEREREISEKGQPNPNRTYFCAVPRTETPFLTMPSACSAELLATARADSWQAFGDYTDLVSSSTPIGPVSGCGQLPFTPSVEVEPVPGTVVPEQPLGLNVDIKVPQEESVTSLAEADVEQTVVTLPEGVAVSPSAANGLAACTDAPEPGRPEGQIALHSSAPVECPDASKIGSVEVLTPLLKEPLKGAMYLAQQEANPFGSLLALYLVAEGSGVSIKLAGEVTPNPVTGQLTTTFSNTPQLPFSDLKVSFYGGPRAPLIAPPGCGGYVTTTRLTPWSGGAAVSADDVFAVGARCTSPFAPSVTAGTGANVAGGRSSFSTAVARGDGEKRLGRIDERLPVGLLGDIKSVPRCGEPQAAQGACPATSQIGRVTTTAGPGSDPVSVSGVAYLTSSYKGAPFGLSVVVQAAAGPFNLGTVVVRARVEVDQHTAAVIVRSDPLPTILKGIPLDVRAVEVDVNRPGFILDPTGCAHKSVEVGVESTDGTYFTHQAPFQAADCERLGFGPAFTAATKATISRSGGAYLRVQVATKAGQSNIAKVHTQIPGALPARLSTLQKSCTEQAFAANPSTCPATSVIGTASAVTPILTAKLSGPVYIVSHAGAAFPDVVALLQGEGITYQLVGNTDIKKGVTYSTFNAVPDVPVSLFEMELPRGSHSIFGAISSPCGKGLVMPTTITAQNGKQVVKKVKIAVSGCPRRRTRKRKRLSSLF
jgi:hypothetical protein